MEHTGLHMEYNVSIIGNFKSIIGTSIANYAHPRVYSSSGLTVVHMQESAQTYNRKIAFYVAIYPIIR